MFFFRKIWRALFSCYYLRLEVCVFALLPSIHAIFTSGRSQIFSKMVVLKIFSKFRKISMLEPFLIKLHAWGLKKRLQHMCFPVNLRKISRTPFLQDTPLNGI